MKFRLLLGVLTLCLLSLWCTPSPLYAQTHDVQLWWVDFHDAEDLARLVLDLDVWEVNHADQRLLAPLDAATAARLATQRSLELSADQSPLEIRAPVAAQTHGIPGYPCYRTVDETNRAVDDLAARDPNLTSIIPIGQSWDSVNAFTPAGDELRVLVVTNRAIAGEKPRLFLMGAIHARELVTTEAVLRFAEVLLDEYGNNAETTWLLDHHELHVLPIANPDGRRIAETGQLWRKNTNTTASCGVSLPFSSYGVDLNRNSSFQWNGCDGCSSANSCSMVYRGPASASEPETQAIESYLRRIFADQRAPDLSASAPDDTTGLMISVHSYGQLVLFPWGWTASAAPNGRQLATLARRFGAPLDYRACAAPACLYATDGSTDDWAYGELGIPSYTIELGTAFFQSCTDFETFIWPPTLQALRYALNVVSQPYRLPSGPSTLDLTATHATVIAGTTLTLTATADDGGLGQLIADAALNEPVRTIRSAAAALGAPPQHNPTAGFELTASDGGFDTQREFVSGSIDTTCLSSGRHTLFVQSQDDADQWGPPASTFVTVTNTSPIALAVTDADQSVYASTTVSYSLQITNSGELTTSFALSAVSEWPIAFPVSTTVPIGPSRVATVTFTVDVPKNAAGTSVPAEISVSSTLDEISCRRLAFNFAAPPWRLSFPTLHLPE